MVTEGGVAGAEDMQHEHLRLQESRNAMVTLAAPPRAANREMLHEPRVTSMEGSRQLRCGRETTALGNLRCFEGVLTIPTCVTELVTLAHSIIVFFAVQLYNLRNTHCVQSLCSCNICCSPENVSLFFRCDKVPATQHS